MNYPLEIYKYLEAVRDRKPRRDVGPDWQRLQKICLSDGLTLWEHETVTVEGHDHDGRYYRDEVADSEPRECLTGKGELVLMARSHQAATGGKPASANQRMAEMLLNDTSVIELTAEDWGQKLNCTAANVKQTPTWGKIMALRAANKNERADRDKGRHIR